MKRISMFFVSCLVSQMAIGKSVSESSAKTAGYNFLLKQGVQVSPADMSLAYKATSTVKGEAVTDFYVFNTGSKGFIIISGDDLVTPVLGYSAEDAFAGNDIPGSVNEWLVNYTKQINYVVEHTADAPQKVAVQWNNLQSAEVKAASKTTIDFVGALVTTKWNQSGYYNKMCPFDATADTNALTGCVATAMAQVMRYWKWPVQGIGSNSYPSTYGTLTANFGTTTYKWDSMPTVISNTNNHVALINSHAGIAVNMHYDVDASGAYVNEDDSPVRNCAEYALKTYFKYKETMHGIGRGSISDDQWVSMMKDELIAKRPMIYTGYGNVGGHCFIADGYTTGEKFHINWGWGGTYNGYYVFDDLTAGTSGFNDGQALLVGITPDNPATLAINEAVANVANVYPNPAIDAIYVNMQNATKITVADIQGRIMKTVTPGGNALTKIDVSELSAGLYIVATQTDKGVTTQKVILNK